MVDKESKKKPLKTIITFSSPGVHKAAVAAGNTSALVEALLANHFGLPIEGDSPQAQLRRDALGSLNKGGLVVPVVKPAARLPIPIGQAPVTNSPTEPQTDAVTAGPGSAEDEPLALPELPVTPPAPDPHLYARVPKVVEPPLPDRPAPPAPEPAFTPVPVAAGYAPGSRVCPNCGQSMGDSPHCLNCL